MDETRRNKYRFFARDEVAFIELAQDCSVCGKQSTIEVEAESFFRWLDGVRIREAFPELSQDDIQTLINGIHPECWKRHFGERAKEAITV